MLGQILDLNALYHNTTANFGADICGTVCLSDLNELCEDSVAIVHLSCEADADLLAGNDLLHKDKIHILLDPQSAATLVPQLLCANYTHLFTSADGLFSHLGRMRRSMVSKREYGCIQNILAENKIFTWGYNAENRILSLSSEMQSEFGVSDYISDHDIETAFAQLVYPGDNFVWKQLQESVKLRQDACSATIRLINKHKEIYWYRIGGRYDPVLSSYSGICQNVHTERTCDERVVLETVRHNKLKEQIRKIQKLSKVGIWKLYREQMKFVWETETEQILGLQASMLLSADDFCNSVHPDDREYFRASIHAMVSGASIEPFEFRISTIKQPLLYIRMQPAGNKAGIKGATVIEGTLQDISALKIYSLELEAKNLQLQSINQNMASHTAEIEAARKKAEESDILKTAFLSNISHEVRTPISSIGGFAELLRCESLSREQRERYIGLILQSNKSLLQIFTDVIELSKINSNQLKINKANVNVNSILREIRDEYQPLLHAKKLQILLDLPLDDSSCVILSDGNKIHRILGAIMDNAIKFTEAGSIRLSYAIHGGRLSVQVQDTGIGIPDEKLKYIFQPFRQGDETLGRGYGGMGIGLSIVDGLVNLLNGTITVKSKIGVGTSVKFSMPATMLDAEEVAPNETSNKCDWSPKTLLIVEDNDINYSYLSELLAKTKIKILHTKTVKESKLILSLNHDIAGVILDFGLPDGSGFYLLRFMHDEGLYHPTLIVTANNVESVKSRCADMIYGDILSKPFVKSDFINKLEKLLYDRNS